VVVGDGDDRLRLKGLSERLGLQDLVQFRGLVPEHALPQAYSDADVFVMPSVKEGFGIVFLEALACGTPVIGGRADGSVDALLGGQLGTLIDPTDIAELRAALGQVAAVKPSGHSRALLRR